jgi:hypothetical protein
MAIQTKKTMYAIMRVASMMLAIPITSMKVKACLGLMAMNYRSAMRQPRWNERCGDSVSGRRFRNDKLTARSFLHREDGCAPAYR